MACIKNYFNWMLLLIVIINTEMNQAKHRRRSRYHVDRHGQANLIGDDNKAASITTNPHPSLKETPTINEAELHKEFWYENAQIQLKEKLKAANKSHKPAKNIILFMGDGMSLPTVTATRQFIQNQLSFEKFPYFGLTKTYSIDSQVTDSAASSTAYLSGVKTNYGTIGVNAQVPRHNCKLGQRSEHQTESIAAWAQAAGKWTGLVTTARVTHASPAGLYAHVANRGWEHNGRIERDNCSSQEILDIARQLVEQPVGQNLRVILGGGRKMFLDKHMNDEDGLPGKRSDKRDLIEQWIVEKKSLNLSAEYVWQKQHLLNLDLRSTEYLLGLFSSSHMPYQDELAADERLARKVPTLSEMTKAAVEFLARGGGGGDEGYFLFVEGARIDMAHHATRARRSLVETAEFARAVEVALNMTSTDETLIVVIADHAHTMTIGGYPQRDVDILGLNMEFASDELPYTILSYANGPGYAKTYTKRARKDWTHKDLTDPKKRYMATVPLVSETHAGDDTGVFASGPHAEMFSGNYEQSYLPLLMAKAAEIGPFK